MHKCSGYNAQGMHKGGGSKPVLPTKKGKKGMKKGSFKKA
jgi:hypothetical protein